MRRISIKLSPTILLLVAFVFLSGCGQDRRKAGLTYFELSGAHHVIGVGTEGRPRKLQKWEAVAGMSGTRVSRGDPFHLEAEVKIVDPKMFKFLKRSKEVYMVAVLSPLYDADGRWRSFTNIQMSCLLTPSGLPIETLQENLPSEYKKNHYRTPFEMVDAKTLGKALRGKTLRFAVDSVIPETVPDGRYRLAIEFGANIQGQMIKLELLPHLGSILYKERGSRSIFLTANATEQSKIFTHHSPALVVGNPAPAKMPWTLFGGVTTHGARGVAAREDRDSFAINFTEIRFGGKLILPKEDMAGRPVVYRLEPDFPTQAVSQEMFEETRYMQTTTVLSHMLLNPVKLDYSSGDLAVSVRAPSGKVYDLGKAPFSKKTELGATTDTGKFDFTFKEYGRHVISMKGFIKDDAGNTYHGGGAYDVWIAMPLGMSTSCKPGMPFTVGNAYSPRVTVHPPVPAEMEYEVKLFRNSLKTDVKTWTHRGKANNYGYYFPREDYEPMGFDSPGEYIAEVTASYTDEDGRLWMGSQISASVVAPADSPMTVHGDRVHVQSHSFSPKTPFEFNARYKLRAGGHAGTPEINDMTMTQIRMQIPYNQEDVLFFSPGLPWNVVEMFPHLSYSTTDKEAARDALKTFPTFEKYVKDNYGQTMKDVDDCWGDYYAQTGCRHILLDLADSLLHKSADNLPVMSVGRKALQPFGYQKDIRILNYYYTSVIRPGMLCRQNISDSTNTTNYWVVTPNFFARQFGAGENGDSPGDMYRLMGGVVYRNLETGKNMYGIYHSSGMVTDPRDEDNRVEAPFKSPLVTVGENDYYLFPGMSPEAGTIYETGDKIAGGGFVFPATKMDYEFRITAPGGKTVAESGSTDSFGLFRLLPGGLRVEKPGVYEIFFKLKRGDLEGATVGKPDGRYYLYAVDRDTPHKLEFDLPETATFDPADALEINGALPRDWAGGKVYFTVVTPGYIFSDGEIEVRNGKFTYRYVPLHAAVFSNTSEMFDIVNEKPGYWDTVAISFFAEGATRDGGKGTAASQIVVRGDRVFARDGKKLSGPPPKLIPEKMYSRFSIDTSPFKYEASYFHSDPEKHLNENCSSCHSTDKPEVGNNSSGDWKKAANRRIGKLRLGERVRGALVPALYRMLHPRKRPAREARLFSNPEKVLRDKCSSCHTATEFAKAENSFEGWKKVVNWHMEKNPLWLRERNRREMVSALYWMFPPRKRPAREARLLSGGFKILKAKCFLCHKKEPILDRSRSRKGWDNLLTRQDYWSRKVRGKPLYGKGERKLLLDYLDLVAGSEAGLPGGGRKSGKRQFQEICFRCHSNILGSYDWARADREAVERHIRHKLGGTADERGALKALDYVFKTGGGEPKEVRKTR